MTDQTSEICELVNVCQGDLFVLHVHPKRLAICISPLKVGSCNLWSRVPELWVVIVG